MTPRRQSQQTPFDDRPVDQVLARLHAFGTSPSTGPVQHGIRRLAFAGWLTGYYATHPMGRARPLRTAARLWAGQIWRRTAARDVRVELAKDAIVDCPAWSKMAGAWVAVGLHEPGEMLFVLRTLARDELFVDIGANLGVYSVLALSRGARVRAFEPTERARRALAHNLALNAPADRFEVSDCALSDRPGSMSFRADLESSNHLVRDDAPGVHITVPVSTLDASLRDGDAPAILKIDAEGFDADVLRGARRVLETHRPAVVVEIWAGGHEVRAELESHGYELFRLDSDTGSLVSMPPDFRRDGYLLAVHPTRLSETSRRLAAARGVGASSAARVEWFAR